jgi:hypothetical protein
VERQDHENQPAEARLDSRDRHDATRRERLLGLTRESEWVFTTLRGTHYTPSSSCFHLNRVPCAVGLGDVSLYLATRHQFGWYALNVLELPPHVIALQLGQATAARSCVSCTATPTL